MTRDHQILEASEERYPSKSLSESGMSYSDIYSRQSAFFVGAKWADSNPKNLWISVDEYLPSQSNLCIYQDYTKQVLARTRKGNMIVTHMVKRGETWEWEGKKDITHWMYLPRFTENTNEEK